MNNIKSTAPAACAALMLLMCGASNAADTSAVPVEHAGAPAKAWGVERSTSALTGKGRLVGRLESSNTVPNSIGREEKVILMVRCTPEGGLESYVAWPAFIGTQPVEVTYRFDSEPLVKQGWNASESGKATGLFKSPAGAAFLDKLSTASRFVIQSPRYSSTPVEAAFDLAEAAEVITEARKTCS